MRTKIICMIDKSGSMSSIKNDSIIGFNTFLKEQQEIDDICYIDVILFDTHLQKLYNNINIQKVSGLDSKNYIPNGGTSLMDCIGITIDEQIDLLAEDPHNKFDKTLCLILTDGESNSDNKYTQEKIKLMIEDMEENFNWNFIFLGANQDAFSSANNIGISSGKSMNWCADSEGINVAYSSISKAAKYYRTTTADNYDDIFKESEKL